MSAAAPTVSAAGLTKDSDVESAVEIHPVVSVLATVIALVVAGLSLLDLVHHGFWAACLHLTVGLSVFLLVWMCVAAALTGRPLTELLTSYPDNDPEGSA